MQAEAEPQLETEQARALRRRLRWPQRLRWRLSLLAATALVLFALAIWIGRERIAATLIDDALTENGLEATYDIVSINPQRQIIENVVVGDPDAPDLTVERVNVDIAFSFGTPTIGRIELIEPRLYGSFRDGALSFGALDPVIYAESDEPAGLPSLDLAIRDGRARIDSEYGTIGAKIEGEGPIDDGFEGILAATAPDFGSPECNAAVATLYGELSSASGRLSFDGPVRLRDLQCESASVANADIGARFTLAEDFSAVEGDFNLSSNMIAYDNLKLASLTGTSGVSWRFAGEGTAEELRVSHDLSGQTLETPFAQFAGLSATGTMRRTDGLSRGEWQADLAGEGIDLALADGSPLKNARDAAEGTFAGTLLAKLERGFSRSLSDGRFAADVTARLNDGGFNLIVREARLRAASGDTVVSLSRLSYTGETGRLSGNIQTGGRDIPRINGRMEQGAGGDLALSLTMAEYREGADTLAIPRMEVKQDRSGRFSFAGLVEAGGAIPDGSLRGLVVPVEGTWSSANGLAIGRGCTAVRIAGLTYTQLELAERSLTVCPADGQAIVSYRDSLRITALTSDLALSGSLAGSPTSIDARSAMLRYPGGFELDGLEMVLGERDNAIRLSAQALSGTFEEQISGSFEGGTAALDLVPLDLSELTGDWLYQDGDLLVSDTAFTLTERTGPGLAPEARFEPLKATGAALVLSNNAIEAGADLRRFAGGQVITNVTVTHDLSTGMGNADILVPGIWFNNKLQPADLSYLARGVIADAEGIVRGIGKVSWTPDGIESSGAFGSDDFNFAAAFGPVRGLNGEVEFIDLINLTTAPAQLIEIGSINPGIETLGGRVLFSLENGEIIRVEDGRWPFMGGELILRPVTIDYSANTGQTYIFEIVGLDAATFVAQMELSNLGADGVFDGTVPIYFDEGGNGSILGGLLISRPPGGNVAYVGELTYEDLGAMGNFAFQTLRSLDYNQMSIELNGSLAGEIVTNFQIDGIRQGEGASRNFITREIAKLPIRFKINVRSENFYLLATIVRGLFDPTVFDTPGTREQLGIGQITPIEEGPDPEPPENPGEAQRRDEPAVQPPESDEMP